MADAIQDLPGEIWKPVVGWEGSYEVSNMGRVKSLERIIRRGDGRDRLHTARLLTPSPSRARGYFNVKLSRDGHERTRRVHHLVLEAFVGPRPVGEEGCHDNDVKADNKLSNLRWDTRKANCADRRRNGVGTASGVRNGRSKLTVEKATAIRAIKARMAISNVALARMYGVSDVTIHRVLLGERWTDAG